MLAEVPPATARLLENTKPVKVSGREVAVLFERRATAERFKNSNHVQEAESALYGMGLFHYHVSPVVRKAA